MGITLGGVPNGAVAGTPGKTETLREHSRRSVIDGAAGATEEYEAAARFLPRVSQYVAKDAGGGASSRSSPFVGFGTGATPTPGELPAATGVAAAAAPHGERQDGVRVRHRYDVTRQSVRDEQRLHTTRAIMADAGYDAKPAHFDRDSGKSAWLNDCLVEHLHAGRSAAAIALLDEHLDVCPSMAVEATDPKTGQGTLTIAAARNMPDVCAKLLRRGAALRDADKFGKTALHVACERGHLDVVKTLLAHAETLPGSAKAAFLAGRPARSSPLQLATRWNLYDIAVFLINAGARVDQRGPADGRTALHTAARFESSECALLLIERGASLEAATTCGRALTPLHVAAMHGASKIAHMLVTRGANFHGPDSSEPPRKTMTPCDLAISCGHRKMTRNLIEEAQHVRRRRIAEIAEIEAAYVKKLNRITKLKRDRFIKLRHLGVAEAKCEAAARKSRCSHRDAHGGASRATTASTAEASELMAASLGSTLMGDAATGGARRRSSAVGLPGATMAAGSPAGSASSASPGARRRSSLSGPLSPADFTATPAFGAFPASPAGSDVPGGDGARYRSRS